MMPSHPQMHFDLGGGGEMVRHLLQQTVHGGGYLDDPGLAGSLPSMHGAVFGEHLEASGHAPYQPAMHHPSAYMQVPYDGLHSLLSLSAPTSAGGMPWKAAEQQQWTMQPLQAQGPKMQFAEADPNASHSLDGEGYTTEEEVFDDDNYDDEASEGQQHLQQTFIPPGIMPSRFNILQQQPAFTVGAPPIFGLLDLMRY
jgi:hypothetical protein